MSGTASCGALRYQMANAAMLTLMKTGRVEMMLMLGRVFFTVGQGGKKVAIV